MTRPILPPLDDLITDFKNIWANQLLTNMGPFHARLEQAISERIAIGHVSLWNNGTTALLAALAALRLAGEVIVTPFTFPATVHAIALLGLTPVFADIDEASMTLCPESAAHSVTSTTSAIVATHVYGNMCETKRLGELANSNHLRVIYDGAHIFGCHPPVFADGSDAIGDVTMLSFHATKLFHTVEGGALIARDAALHGDLKDLRNFGIQSEDVVSGVGLNGKMSELHAAVGLQVLARLDSEIEYRARLSQRYVERLAEIPGVSIVAGHSRARQYLVVRIDAAAYGRTRDELHTELRALNVISRRYFYPLCSQIEPYASHPSASNLPIASRVASECLALPLHGEMSESTVDQVCDAIQWLTMSRCTT